MPRKTSGISRSCPNPECGESGTNIIRYGFFQLKRGKRRRYRCKACRKTFCSTTDTPYYRVHGSRNTFAEACHLSVEGASISTIARVKRKTWNTVYRWLERARTACKAFNENNLKQFDIKEPQADEIRTFVDDKKKTTWVMTLLETTSRLWPSCLVGKRSYRNIRRLFRDTLSRSECHERLLITTDGFKPYGWVIGRMFGSHCIYGQVIKTYRNGRASRVKRSLVIGTTCQLEEALSDSEDSTKLNTAFVERHNLTIRQGSAYLQRKSSGHARQEENLAGHLHMFQCYYNFIRPHMGLKFGTEVRTPAMVAGIVKTKLSFRHVFSRMIFFVFRILEGEGRPAFEMAA